MALADSPGSAAETDPPGRQERSSFGMALSSARFEREAALVRLIFYRFAKTGSALSVACELNAAGEVTKRRARGNGTRGGKPWTKGAV
jgi:hypothetical protein